jgi:predicted GNAT superfamily acetyltransferase
VTAGPAGIAVRPLVEFDDLRRCVEFQERIWGAGFNELVPAAILWVAANTGGIVAAAVDDRDDFAGFIFGITGWRDREPIHWSDMLAVRQDLRGRGIGIMLKRYQRDTLLERGVLKATWTFDPLESRNAHLNLTRLGATAREYRRDCYGPGTSPLHSLGTDRRTSRGSRRPIPLPRWSGARRRGLRSRRISPGATRRWSCCGRALPDRAISWSGSR